MNKLLVRLRAEVDQVVVDRRLRLELEIRASELGLRGRDVAELVRILSEECRTERTPLTSDHLGVLDNWAVAQHGTGSLSKALKQQVYRRAIRKHRQSILACRLCGFLFDDGVVSNALGLEVVTEAEVRDGLGAFRLTQRDRQVEVDHLVPQALGGGTSIANLQVLCGYCNAGKSDYFGWVDLLLAGYMAGPRRLISSAAYKRLIVGLLWHYGACQSCGSDWKDGPLFLDSTIQDPEMLEPRCVEHL